MKELSIEEKAKRYDEAIERAKDFIKGEVHYALRKGENIMCWVFPELCESEDERIKKFLIQMAQNGHWGDKDWWNKCVAWLEKQGQNNMGISEATKKKLEDNLNKALEKETPESFNEFLDEQKPAEWSDEDELMISRFNNCIGHYYADNFITKEQQVIMEDWIKALKDRVQPKQEWSEEDEGMLYGVIETEQYMLNVVTGVKTFDVGNEQIESQCTKELAWLKILKDRCTWKPSDRQMKAIEHICDGNYNVDLDILDSIYRDFKKLRQE